MKVIFIPGFWDAPNKFDNISDLLKSRDIEFKVLDYKNYKNFGNKIDLEVFSKILSELDSDLDGSIIMCYSMGASFLYDYLKKNKIKPAKLIFINPLLERVGNEFVASYKRVLDMYKQKQLVKSVLTAQKDLLPLTDIAYLQQKYNKSIEFDKKLNFEGTFIWSDKDIICPISNYDKYKEYFSKTELIVVPNQHHNWLVYDEIVKDYLLPAIISA